MKHRGRGKGKPVPPTSVAGPPGEGASPGRASTRPAPKGFAAAFNELADRKKRELGAKWGEKPQRSQLAEARRRAADEMASRIERQSGHRPAASTIRRNAAKGTTPRWADKQQLDRQARVDKLGGIKKLAQKIGVSAKAVTRWRDGKGPMSSAAVTVTADFEGSLISDERPYPRNVSAAVSTSDPDEADDIRAAEAIDDYDELAQLLSPLVTNQVEWSGDAEREYIIDKIENLRLS